MRRIKFDWQPHTGQKIIAVNGLAVGEQVEFYWHTTREDDPKYPFSKSGAKNGNFFVDSLPGSNGTITGEIRGVVAQGAAGGAIKSGSGQTSFHWSFTKNFMMEPDKDYSVLVTISNDAASINGKLNCGTRS
jgi:hypothetical protein